MPYRQLAEDILARWRAAERNLETATVDDAAALRAEIDELRAAYQRLIDEARVAQREEPPPFPSQV
jgi:ubiquinone biosynthesis protein UbiJ